MYFCFLIVNVLIFCRTNCFKFFVDRNYSRKPQSVVNFRHLFWNKLECGKWSSHQIKKSNRYTSWTRTSDDNNRRESERKNHKNRANEIVCHFLVKLLTCAKITLCFFAWLFSVHLNSLFESVRFHWQQSSCMCSKEKTHFKWRYRTFSFSLSLGICT